MATSLEFASAADLGNKAIEVVSVKKRYVRDSLSPLGELDRTVVILKNKNTLETKTIKLSPVELGDDAGDNQIRDAVLKKISFIRKETELQIEYNEVALTVVDKDITKLDTTELAAGPGPPPPNPFQKQSSANGEAKGVYDSKDKLVPRFITHSEDGKRLTAVWNDTNKEYDYLTGDPDKDNKYEDKDGQKVMPKFKLRDDQRK
tara:strand:+ start:219 stop:830 length:612 start_codon:yes stop_codon:yes gene_type:complete